MVTYKSTTIDRKHNSFSGIRNRFLGNKETRYLTDFPDFEILIHPVLSNVIKLFDASLSSNVKMHITGSGLNLSPCSASYYHNVKNKILVEEVIYM